MDDANPCNMYANELAQLELDQINQQMETVNYEVRDRSGTNRVGKKLNIL